MSVRLIPRSSSLEYEMTLSGLKGTLQDRPERDSLVFYGGQSFTPGAAYDDLLQAYASGSLVAIIALTIEEKFWDVYPDVIREGLGRILQLSPFFFCVDELSAEGALHYACAAKVGGHPGWLADPTGLSVERFGLPESVRTVAAAMYCALVGHPVVLYQPPVGGRYYHPSYMRAPLRRFAVKFDLPVACDEDDLADLLERRRKGDLPTVAKADVEKEQEAARQTIRIIQQQLPETARKETVQEVLSRALNEAGMMPGQNNTMAVEVAPGLPRELVLGTVFDPKTHYCEDYFGGKGLLYTYVDGTKKIYRGPGRDWEGFDLVGKHIKRILDDEKQLLSVGCGFGSDVKRFVRQGLDAYGVDISEAAVADCCPEVADRIFCADVLTEDGLVRLPFEAWGVITAWDFWEHIWLCNVEKLAKRLYMMLPSDGVMYSIICTRTPLEQDWTVEPGAVFTKENSWLLASGHVTIRTWQWWLGMFGKCGFEPRYDLAYKLQVALAEDPRSAGLKSWSPRHLVVVGKP